MPHIFLHGLGQNAQSWAKTAEFLPENINAEYPELSGFFTEECNYNSLYDGLCGYLSRFEAPFHLCGLSLGAVLALNYAADFPDKVDSLVLIAPQFRMPKTLLKFQNIIFRFLPEKQFVETGLTKSDFISLTSSMAELDFSGKLQKICCQTLIICGEKDSANKKAAVELSQKLSNSELVVAEKSGHEVNIDNPTVLAALISDFWSKAPD